jgi:hypothetical protein
VKSLPSKRRVLKKEERGARIEKRGETPFEKLHISKKGAKLKRKRGESSVEKLHVLRRG